MKTHKLEQRSPEWLAMKKGKIGGTRAGMIGMASEVTAIYEILAEQGMGDVTEPTYKSAKMEEASEMEVMAYNAYNEQTGITMNEYGWLESDDNEIVGISPDGYNPTLKKAIETKCLLAKNHVEVIILNKIPAKYKRQVLHYFVVIEDLESLDFILYNPYYQTKPLHIITVTREELADEIEQAKAGLVKFLEKLEKYKLKLK